MNTSYPDKKKEDLRFNSRFGKYLIGNLNTWHGGIHLENDTQIKAIADGRIIAYRLNDVYKKLPEVEDPSGEKDCPKITYQYSNNFILIQHDLELLKETKTKNPSAKKEGDKTEEKKEEETEVEKKIITFYSLYNHLRPTGKYKKEVTLNGIEIPEIYRKQTAKVTASEGFEGKTKKVEGLNARIPHKNGRMYPLSDKQKQFVIPKGTILEKYENENRENEIIDTNYIRVIAKDYKGNKHDNVYINKKKTFVEKADGDKLKIKYSGDPGSYKDDSSLNEEQKKQKGARVRKTTKGGEIIKIIPTNEEIEILEIKDKKVLESGDVVFWIKAKGYEEGYTHSSNFDVTIDFDDSFIQNEIVACDISIKAGETIGHTGLVESAVSGSGYKATHLEVFMEEGVSDFLTNKFKPEKEEDKKYAIIPSNTLLSNEIKENLTESIPKNTPVTVKKINGNYAQIVIPEKISETFDTKGILYTPNKSGEVNGKKYKGYTTSNGYDIIDFNKLNKIFHNLLKKDSSKVFYDHFSSGTERKIYFSPNRGGEKFWIERKYLSEVIDEDEIKTRTRTPKSILEAPSVKDCVTNPDYKHSTFTNEFTKSIFGPLNRLFKQEPEKIVVPEEVEEVIPHNLLSWQEIPKFYLIKPTKLKTSIETNFDKVNKIFNNQLLSEDAKLYPSKKGSKVDALGNKNANGNHRRVYYKLREADDKLNHKITKIKTGSHEAEKDEEANLLSNVATIYHTVPLKQGSLTEERTCKDAVIKVDNLKKLEAGGKNYKYVVCEQILGTEALPYVQKGWIDASILKKDNYFSAYNWDRFGFSTIEDAGDEYMYEVSGHLNCKDTTSNFVKKLWGKIDKNDSSVIDKTELNTAYKSIEFQDIVSKIVCKHKNEWSYKPDELKDEISNFFDYFIKAKPAEYHSSMNDLKEKNLDLIKEQATKLMFWDEASKLKPRPDKVEGIPPLKPAPIKLFDIGLTDADREEFAPKTKEVTPKKDEKKKKEAKKIERKFPSSEVYHFHPIAFINQMKLMFPEQKMGNISLSEARVRAFMRMFREGEGTVGEEGYTTAFDNNKITDLSTHPQKNYGGSTAAGAYQIMRYTWWELNGEVLDDNFEKTGKRNEKKDYIKKYKIPDYSPLSQDRVCAIIFRHKRDGILNLIMKGDIEQAIRKYGSAEWASLPHVGDKSRYKYKGKLQPATPMEKCIRHFNKYLKKELNGSTDLHVQYGFLNEFGIDCEKRDESIKESRGAFNIEEAIKTLNQNAQPKSIGKCGKYVRFALEGGELNTTGHPEGARDYDAFLTAKGFDILAVENLKNYKPVKGDIAVFEAFKGDKKNHPWGHVQMHNGTQWVSDFKQNNFWAGSDYSKAKPAYTILRWIED